MEISNKTLAMFLVAAIAVSLFGTIFSLNKLGSLSTTGFATTDTGTANVYVNTTTSINFAISAINWGTGIVNTSAGYLNCTLATGVPNSAGCSGFTYVTQGFVLENDGNTLATVRLASNATAALMIGGGAEGGGPVFMYKVADNESNSCVGENPTTFTDVNTTAPGTAICPSTTLNYTDTQDSLNISVYINIPYTSPQGQKAATFTATASNP